MIILNFRFINHRTSMMSKQKVIRIIQKVILALLMAPLILLVWVTVCIRKAKKR